MWEYNREVYMTASSTKDPTLSHTYVCHTMETNIKDGVNER